MNVPSPCIEVCQLDACGICLGCFRSVAEIARWSRLTELEKAGVLAALDGRRAKSNPAQDNQINK